MLRIKLCNFVDLVENKVKADWGLNDCVDCKLYYLLQSSQDIAWACAHTCARLRAQSVRARKANPLMLSQLEYYTNGNRRAVLLYRLFAIRIASENGAFFSEFRAWHRQRIHLFMKPPTRYHTFLCSLVCPPTILASFRIIFH